MMAGNTNPPKEMDMDNVNDLRSRYAALMNASDLSPSDFRQAVEIQLAARDLPPTPANYVEMASLVSNPPTFKVEAQAGKVCGCDKCGGSGQYRNDGDCYRCAGKGFLTDADVARNRVYWAHNGGRY